MLQLTVHHDGIRSQRMDGIAIRLEKVLSQDYHVRRLPGLDRADPVFQPELVGPIQSVSADEQIDGHHFRFRKQDRIGVLPRLQPLTRELARMIREAGIDFSALPDEPADELMGRYTGAATIFGATGGVMEAAVRSAYTLITGQELEAIDITPLRGIEGVKEAEIPVADLNVRVAIAHGLGNARVLLDEIRDGKSPYHFIEIMACPGGCVGGGGQPFGFDLERRETRGQTLYQEDSALPLRKSHHNPRVTQVYEEFLEKPLGEKSHHLLHTKYTERGIK